MYTTFALQSRTNLTCGTTESTPSFTTEAPEASPRGRGPNESRTDRATSETAPNFTLQPFSQADVRSGDSQWPQRVSAKPYQSLGTKINIYRHPIHTFDITALDGKEKWTTYNFTVGVYIYSLRLIKKIRSVINDLPPDFNLEHSQKSEPQTSEHSGLSQQFGNQVSAQTPGEQDSESSHGDLRPITPDTSMQTNPKKKTKRP